MAEKAINNGVQIFQSEPVHSINKNLFLGYHIVTSKQNFKTERVIIAVPPVDLPKIKGDIVDAIVAQPEFKSIVPVRVTSVTQWYDRAWRRYIKRSRDNANVWRAWTTDSCINAIEIPQEKYLLNEFAIRTVYNDRFRCAQHFEFLARTNMVKLEQQIYDGLTQPFSKQFIH